MRSRDRNAATSVMTPNVAWANRPPVHPRAQMTNATHLLPRLGSLWTTAPRDRGHRQRPVASAQLCLLVLPSASVASAETDLLFPEPNQNSDDSIGSLQRGTIDDQFGGGIPSRTGRARSVADTKRGVAVLASKSYGYSLFRPERLANPQCRFSRWHEQYDEASIGEGVTAHGSFSADNGLKGRPGSHR